MARTSPRDARSRLLGTLARWAWPLACCLLLAAPALAARRVAICLDPCPRPTCPDDYRPKCLPAAPCPTTGCRDDYGRKPLPCPPRCAPLGCDDYRPKCGPIDLRYRGPCHTCVPTGCR